MKQLEHEENDFKEVLKVIALKLKEKYQVENVTYLQISLNIFKECEVRISPEVAMMILQLCNDKIRNKNMDEDIKDLDDVDIDLLYKRLALEEQNEEEK